MTTVTVLNHKIHGMDARGYAEAIRERTTADTVEFAPTAQAALELAASTDVLTGFEVPDGFLERANDLALFACIYAGTDHLPHDRLADAGVAVTSAAGVHAPNASEQALAGLLYHTRRLDLAETRGNRHEWRHFQTGELAGSTVGVVGMGHIGTALLDRLEPFDVERVGIRHSPGKGGPAERVLGYDDFHSVLPDLDAVAFACPLTEETEGLLGGAELMALPPNAIVVNIARGKVIETDALVTALRKNGIAGAYLDVTDPEPLPEDHPLWTIDNCLITPHNAGYTPEYWNRRADILARNLDRQEKTGRWGDLENQVG